MTELLKKYADQIGISGSFICLLHCTIFPLLGILSTSAASSSHGHTHFFIGDDLFFAIVAIFAAYFAAKNTHKQILKISFWFFSITFSVSLITSEIFEPFHWTIYLAHICALSLIVTHGYHFFDVRRKVRCQVS